jgi:hypothetical protein
LPEGARHSEPFDFWFSAEFFWLIGLKARDAEQAARQ